jgi:GGDEF domain-containing protein
MPAAPIGRRRPRPVADVPSLDARELARAWLVELVAAAPLERAAGLPGPGFATQAPRLCEAVVAALSSDAAFADLEPGGAAATVAADAAIVAGADGPAEAVAALEALRGATWDALVEALHRPSPSLLADLADRLAATIATVAAAALEGASLTTRPGERGPLGAILRPQPPPPAAGEPRAPSSADAPLAPPPPSADPLAAPSPDPAAHIEAEAFAALDAQRRRGSRVEDGGGFHSRSAPWTAAVERRLARHVEDGRPFALLCIEVADLDRLIASERDGDVALALEAAEAGVCAQLRPADVLVRERPGRYWLVAPDSDADAARSLAHLLAAAVAGVAGPRGAPLEAAIGIATCPHDGREAAALEGRAEEGLFAARAAGLRVAGPPPG